MSRLGMNHRGPIHDYHGSTLGVIFALFPEPHDGCSTKCPKRESLIASIP